MEEIDKRLTTKQKEFLKNLSLYIDKPLHLYGSIYRSDYIKGKSDIDIDIFTENESSTMSLLCNFLNLKKNSFKRIVHKINTTIITGYKVKYKDEKNDIVLEISIYNNKYEKIILEEHDSGKKIPFYIVFVLLIVKTLYYNLNILSKKTYQNCKRFLMNENNEIKFVLVDN